MSSRSAPRPRARLSSRRRGICRRSSVIRSSSREVHLVEAEYRGLRSRHPSASAPTSRRAFGPTVEISSSSSSLEASAQRTLTSASLAASSVEAKEWTSWVGSFLINPTVSVTTKSGRAPRLERRSRSRRFPRRGAWWSPGSRRACPWWTCSRRSGRSGSWSCRRWCSRRGRRSAARLPQARAAHAPCRPSRPSSLRFIVAMRSRITRLSYSSCCSPGPLGVTPAAARGG